MVNSFVKMNGDFTLNYTFSELLEYPQSHFLTVIFLMFVLPGLSSFCFHIGMLNRCSLSYSQETLKLSKKILLNNGSMWNTRLGNINFYTSKLFSVKGFYRKGLFFFFSFAVLKVDSLPGNIEPI